MATAAILRKARESALLSIAFFESHAGELERCANALVGRFERGGRLLVMGNGGSSCDAEHVAVEFTHPIIKRRRPLPAFALADNRALLTAISNDSDYTRVFLEQVDLFGRAADVLLGISTTGESSNINRGLERGRERGLMTIGFAGGDGGRMPAFCDYMFIVPAWSVQRVQEVHTVLLHLLWDQVHLSQGEADVL
jgi:D-sedoheptulose 7-phosphate isomerase